MYPKSEHRGAEDISTSLERTADHPVGQHVQLGKSRGIGDVDVTACAWIDRCSINYTIYGEEVELRLGGNLDGFYLTTTETGLENLVAKSSAALNALRAAHDDT
ncbi:hypothetical protein [Saccharopolyspora pogona]|uniref:hypothetical protein n=1 Tax=Saccharopolyspora pogona TaxID=333966 RepID=UPI001CC27023|nr:hypothetical protein [Saccharopolyspora pogona]